MSDYGLFIKYKFNDANGIFLSNKKPRRPDCRYWDQVIENPVGSGNFFTLTNRMMQDPANPGGPLIPVSSRVNADTKTMELVARTHPPTSPLISSQTGSTLRSNLTAGARTRCSTALPFHAA